MQQHGVTVKITSAIYFLNYLIKGATFVEKLLKTKYGFWISLKMLCEIFLILRKIQWHFIINVLKYLL
jgi:hypothetical protein